MATQSAKAASESPSLIKRISSRFHVDADKLMNTLKLTAFKQKNGDPEITNEQMMALLVVADQYGLNPFTKEIYAFPDKGGIVPVVGVDGWSRIINEHSQYDGMEIAYSDVMTKPEGSLVTCPEWIDVSIFRKDRNRPTVIREYLDEVYRKPFTAKGNNGPYTLNGPWQTHPKRFLRHKGIIQCSRIALGFTGIYDQDEAERIIDMGEAVIVTGENRSAQNAAGQPLSLEVQKLDPLVQSLIERSRSLNSWEPANQYAMQHFQGREFQYVTEKLRDAQIADMPSALNTKTAAPVENAGTPTSQNQTPLTDDLDDDEIPLGDSQQAFFN